MINEGRLRKAWGKLREAGGSIHGPNGANLTGSAGGAMSFAKFANDLCSNDAEFVDPLTDFLEEVVRQQQFFADANAQRFTWPKCYSKPDVQLAVGCQFSVTWHPSNSSEESDCSDGQ